MKKHFTSTSEFLSFSSQLFNLFTNKTNSFRVVMFFRFCICCVSFLFFGTNQINAQIVISGFLSNPAGNDGNNEYVQLLATQNINFATTPFSIIWANNGTATSNGWVACGAITYKFELTTGTVNKGDVFYVGGSGKILDGTTNTTSLAGLTWIRAISVTTSGGDGGCGTLQATAGVMGNGGTNADGIGVFSGTAITATTVPIDAVFYGSVVGTAKPATGGYVLPTNDLYSNSQGTFGNGTNTFVASDPASDQFIKLTGTFNTASNSWTTNRVSSLITLNATSTISSINTGIAVVSPTITGSATASPFTTTYGTASNTQSFSVSGANLTADLIATAPTGFEVSSDGITYSSTATFTQSSGSASGNLRTRLAANAAVTGSYNSQNIVLSSTGATSVNITTSSSGNIVAAKALTINGITADNKVYDRTVTTTLSGTATYVGLANNETFSVTGTPTATFATASVGSTKPVTVNGYAAPSSNYTVTQPTGLTADITTKSLTVSNAVAESKVYDGNTNAVISGTTLSGVISPDNVTVAGNGTFASTDANAQISVTTSLILAGADNTNYSIIQPTGLKADITAKSLTITGLSATNKVYDRTTNATLSGSPVLNGVVGSDDVSLSGSASATFSNKLVGDNKMISVTGYSLSGTKANNYTVAQPTGLTANITPLALTISNPVAQNKVYDRNSNASITGTLTGVISPDDVTLSATGSFASSNVGDANSVSSTSTISGADATNYTLTQPTGLSANITQKSLTINGITANNKIYDGNTNANLSGTATLSGIVAGDENDVNLAGTPSATFAQSNVGTGIAVTVTGFSLTGTASSNYSLTQPTGLTADITNALTPVINSTLTTSATYGTVASSYTITATNNPTSFNATGLPAGLTINTTTGEITGTPTSVTGSPFNVTISATNNGGTGTAILVYTINKKELMITNPTANNKVYDRTNTATISGTLNGVFGSDDVVLNGTGTFAQVNVGVGLSVTSTSTLTGADATKYTLTQPTGLTADITTKSLTVSNAVAQNKVYDGNTNAVVSGATLNGVISPDNVTVAGNGTFATADANAQISVTTSLNLAGTDNTNYSIIQPTGLKADITAKSLTITGLSGTNKVYDRTTNATLSGSPILNGVVGSDDVSLSGSASATFSDKLVGDSKMISVTGYTLSGTKANNYSVTQPTGLTANITPLALIISNPVAQNKVYDRNSNASITGTLTGVISPDDVTLSATGSFASSNVGDGISVSSTSTISGADATNYTLTQPTGLTANITQKSLTINGITANDKYYDGTTTATLSGIATATLTGIVMGDESNVTLGGTPIANFAQSAVGNSIAVTVSGFTISGTASSNYSLVQPSGLTANIITVPAPVINSVLTASATYGTVASTYTITATNNPTSFNATGLPAGLTINTTTGEITGTPTSVTGSPFNVTISATNNGGTGMATLIYTINKKALTITTPVANNKVYDKTNIATISGTLNGVFGSDDVLLNGTGTFSQVNVGVGLSVTSTSTLTGADATKYTLTQPTGLTANITAKPLSITGITARNKYFDGTTTATLSGIAVLNGILSGDVVTLGGTALANFVQSSVGNGVGVTVTGYTIGGASVANYSVSQPTGLIANITATPIFTEVIFPQYIQGVNTSNTNRIPFAYRASINGLAPNTSYRYYNGVELTTATANSVGAGNNIFPSSSQANSFTYSTGPSLSTAGGYGTFTTDATGTYTGWFIIAPSANATRFVPGTNLYTRIALIDEAATYSSTVISSTNTIKVINLVNSAGANNGTGLRGNSGANDKNFVFVYDNTSGTGRPLSGTFVENDGAAETTSFATFYSSNVDGVAGAYGLVIPNTNANGVRRIEQRDFNTGAITGCPATDADGVWTSGANTVNPTGGTTAIAITLNDAPLNTCVVVNTPPTIGINVSSTSDYIDGGITTSPASSFASSSVLSDPTNAIESSGIDFTIADVETPVANLVVTATSTNTAVVPNANLNLTGTGASRNLKISPIAVGYSDINVSVNDGTTTTTFTINFAASAASVNSTTTRFHTGTSDASTAQMIDNNLMVVGDDENQALRIYNRQNSGLPISSFDFTSSLGLTDISAGVLREVDVEASAKVGNRIYWLGSHSNAANGNTRPNRYRFFATDITGTGNATTLTYVGRYDGLKTDLLAWDANNLHGLGANYLGLSASSASGIAPEIADGSGFNIEGLEIAPDNSTAYICFRAPLETAATRNKALIVPLTNFTNLVTGNPTTTTATFGSPILLDLGGRAIREMKRNANGEYLIIAGPNDGSTGIAPKNFRLYTWTGRPTDAPILKSTNLTALNVDGSFESIVDVPNPLSNTSQIQLLVDNGDAIYYNDGIVAKDLTQNNFIKFRSETINLGSSALAISSVSGTTFCDNSNFDVTFTTTETFNTGNIFTLQLSNANGSFSNPTSIGTLTGVNAGTITATIPLGTAYGSGYRVRVVASNTQVIGVDNGTNLTIYTTPSAPVAQNNTQIISGESITLTATGCSGSNGIYTLKWYQASNEQLVTMPVSPTTTTTYYAKCVSSNNTTECSSPKSSNVILTVLPQTNTTLITSITSGNWETSTTWDLGRIPQNGDTVVIDSNHNVTLSGTGTAKNLKYNGTGKLIMNSTSSQLKVGQ